MFGLGPATRIYLAVGATDMRKGFEGLYGLVRDRLGLRSSQRTLSFYSPTDRRNRLKVFYSGMGVGYGFAPNDWKRDVSAGLGRMMSRLE